ncbi:hypothetical protein QUB80_14660 [Chlorogloeopsis sp. ULAP01]|uniref:hypothetical protein n=1 Tax=Chlorogloeopsis sp. ULAP01 TaxID=3056483 RepID=UPI0025AA7986|nr:hypothetical protein [Chlorogloeopsis sp. ULAP01]MDM9381944.1 hypothetical protein [Chlorogloeopsis sp. ULAP01]
MAGGVPKNQRRKGLRGEPPTLNSEQSSFVASMNGQNGKNQQRQVRMCASTQIL